MSDLILKRLQREPLPVPGDTKVRISNSEYNKVLDVADETGLSCKEIVNRMVAYAYEHVKYEAGEQK